jgi:methylase of polypeptide subunit release factors
MKHEPEATLVPRGRYSAFPVIGKIWKTLLRVRFQLFHRHRHDRLVLEEVGGIPLLVLPTVFNPALLLTGEFMERELSGERIPPGATVLDLGCGTGIGAVLAARAGGPVVAADINLAALRCTRLNTLLNGIEEQVEVVESDLFSALEGQRFDVVLFNPPFYRGAPKDDLDRAWRGEDLFERFAAGLPAHLKAGGCALVVFSTEGDVTGLLEAFHTRDLEVELIAEHDRINEVLILYRVRSSQSPEVSGR